MGTAPRTAGGGSKFKKAITDLANAQQVLLWTNNNMSAQKENWDITLSAGYAAICVTVTEYSGSYESQNNTFIVMGASGYLSARSNYRYCTFDGKNLHAGPSHNATSGGTSYNNVQPYKIYGIAGTEIK